MAKGTFLKFLNFNQASYRCILSLQFVMSGWGTGYSFGCDLLDPSQSPQAMRVRAEEMLLYLLCENLCPVFFFSFLFFSCYLAPGFVFGLDVIGFTWLKCSTEPFRPPAIHLFLSDIIVSDKLFVLYLIDCMAFELDLYFSFSRWHGLAGSITSPSSLRCWTQWVMFPIYYLDFMTSALLLLLKQTAYITANSCLSHLWHSVLH